MNRRQFLSALLASALTPAQFLAAEPIRRLAWRPVSYFLFEDIPLDRLARYKAR